MIAYGDMGQQLYCGTFVLKDKTHEEQTSHFDVQ